MTVMGWETSRGGGGGVCSPGCRQVVHLGVGRAVPHAKAKGFAGLQGGGDVGDHRDSARADPGVGELWW